MPTFQTSSAVANSTNSTSLVVTAPTGIVAGDFLVAFCMSIFHGGVDFTAPSGWTEAGFVDSAGNGGRLSTYTKTATASEPGSYTWTGNQWLGGCILRYSGTSGIDGTAIAFQSSNSSTTMTAPSVTTTGTTDTMVCCIAPTNGAAVTPALTGMTNRATANNASGPSVAAFDQTLSASGATGTRTSSFTSGFGFCSCSLALASPTPPPVAGYNAWYDAQQITGLSDNTAMTSWADLSGNGFTLTTGTGTPTYFSSTTAKLINGHPVVYFNGDGYIISSSGPTSSQPFTIFAVVINTGTSTNYICGHDGTTYTWGQDNHSGGLYRLYAGSFITGGATDANYHVLTGQWNGSSSLMRVDGTQVASGNPGSATMFGYFVLGNSAGSVGGSWNGPIGEVIVYPSALTTGNMASVESYLATKWAPAAGVTATLSLGPITTTSSGTITVTGTATVTVGPVSLTATGPATITGTATVALGPVTLAVNPYQTGSMFVSVGPVTVTANGSSPAAVGTAAIHVGPVTLTTLALMTATVAVNIGPLSLTAVGGGAAKITVGPVTVTATGAQVAGGGKLVRMTAVPTQAVGIH